MNKKVLFYTLKYALRSYPLIRPYLGRVDKLFDMSQAELDEYNNEQFVELVNFAYNKSTFYHNFYDKHGVNIASINGMKDIEKLPVIDKQIVRENIDDIAIGNRLTLMSALTGGTTGASLKILQDYKAVLSEQAYLYKYRCICGYKQGQPIVSLRAHLDSKNIKLKLPVGNILYLSSYQINQQNIAVYLDEIVKHKPVAIEGFPSSIYNLCCLFKEHGIRLSIPLCFTSSETLYDYQRNLFKEVLNCDTYDWYGCTEKTVAIVESINHNGFFELPGYSYNEFSDNSIITTSFINNRFPLIRYRVNDKIALKNNYVKNKSIDPNIETIEGRTEAFIITRSGTAIGRLASVFKGVDYIKLAQIVQRKQGEIEINIVPDGPFCDDERMRILKHVDERIGLNDISATINVVTNKEIIYSRRNKFNQIVRL